MNYIEGFLEGTGRPYDWDDFISLEIENPALEEVRERAARLHLPVKKDGLISLQELLAEARAIASRS